jgi:hypothetical protein
MCEIISRTTHRARIQHQCWECLAPINPGEQYHVQFIADGGNAWSNKVHVECDLDAQSADGLMDDGDDCRTWTLCDWAFESGVPLDQLGLRPETTARLQYVRQRQIDRAQLRHTTFFAELPSGRWADDGGPA